MKEEMRTEIQLGDSKGTDHLAVEYSSKLDRREMGCKVELH
jgi:hypothetical protein